MKRSALVPLVALGLAACESPTHPSLPPADPPAGSVSTLAACPSAGGIVTTDLGTMPGGTFSEAHAVSGRKLVVGVSTIAGGARRAFLWTAADGFRNLGTLGGNLSEAYGVSDRGHVVGMSTTARGVRRAFRWTSDGGMQDLGHTIARDVNRAGEATGNSGGTPVVWSASGVAQSIPVSGLREKNRALAINNVGQVVGTRGYWDGEWLAFVWTRAGGPRDLATVTGYGDEAHDINDNGQAVGGSDYVFDSDGNMATHAFLWPSPDRLQDLGLGFAYGINNQGQVVGSNPRYGATRAVLWSQAGVRRELGALPGGTSSVARDINDLGQIVGSGTTSGGQTHAIIWTLLGTNPNPGALLALAAETQSRVPRGALTSTQARALVLKVEQAGRDLAAGRRSAAVTQLRSYVSDVQALMNNGQLPRAEGQPLVDQANCVIARLS
jgi:probable HAF family extracellular repeat protein